MKRGDLIVVYGTLRPGHRANGYLASRAKHLGKTRFSAMMYTLGGFPGVKLVGEGNFMSDGPTVVGDLYEIENEGLPQILDTYEGYPNLYGRRKVEVEDGRKAWVYTYNHAVSDSALIPSGDWNNVQAAAR